MILPDSMRNRGTEDDRPLSPGSAWNSTILGRKGNQRSQALVIPRWLELDHLIFRYLLTDKRVFLQYCFQLIPTVDISQHQPSRSGSQPARQDEFACPTVSLQKLAMGRKQGGLSGVGFLCPS